MKYIIRNDAVRANCIAAIQKLPLGVHQIEISVHEKVRSDAQLRRQWWLYSAMQNQVKLDGRHYSAEVWHEHCARKFLGCEPTPDGYGKPKSTKKLGVRAMADYLTQVEVYAIELGVDTVAYEAVA